VLLGLMLAAGNARRAARDPAAAPAATTAEARP